MSDVDVIIKVHTQGVQQIGNLSASLRNLSNTLRGVTVPMSKMDAQTKAVYKALGITSRGVNDHAKSIKNLAQNQKVLLLEQKKVVGELRTLKNAYALAGRETTQLGRNIGVTTRELQSFSRNLRGLRLKAFGSDLHNISLRFSKMGKDAQFVGRSLLINLTLPLATFARVGLQSFTAVDKEMTRLVKVSENLASTMDIAAQKMGIFEQYKNGIVDEKQIERMQKMVLAFEQFDYKISTLSLKFGVAKEMVASLAADFAELGITSEDNVEKLTLMTLQIEKLGNMDIGPAQDLATALYFQSRRALEVNGALKWLTTARARERESIRAAKAQMLLFNSVENATALTLKDLGDAFPEVASAATSFGLSMTEAAALLAPMKAAGLDVGASANSIKVSLQRLIAPTKQNTDMLNKLAERYGVAGDAQNEFTLSAKTGLIGLDATVRMFDKVRSSSAGMEGALRLMSDLFEKRQGPRMYLAIEQLADFNRELEKTALLQGDIIPPSAAAEVQLAKTAELATKGWSKFNTITPKTIRSFKDIGNVARIATARAGQRIQIEPGVERIISQDDINQARMMRKAVSDLILEKKKAEGIDLISEVKTEAGRAMIIELAGAANAQAIAQQELDRSLETVGVQVDRIKIAFKQFASEIIKRMKPALDNLADRVVNFLKKWASPEMKEARERIVNLILSIGTLLATMGPIILAVGTFQSVVGNLGKGLSVMIPKLKNANNEFVGLGKSISLAHQAMKKLYTAAVTKPIPGTGIGTGSPLALIPGATRIPGMLPKAPKPIDRAALLDKAKRDAMRAAGISRQDAARAAKEYAARATVPTTGSVSSSRLPGTRGQRLPRNVVEAMKIIQARELADVTPGAGGVLRDRFGRVVSGTGDVAQKRLAMRQTLQPALARFNRQLSIFRKSPFLEQAGIATDRMGTQFFRAGRQITEEQANAIAKGGLGSIRARTGIAATQARERITAPFAAVKSRLTAAGTPGIGARGTIQALAPKMFAGASQSVTDLKKKFDAIDGSAPSTFRKIGAAIKGATKSIKLATSATKLFRVALLFTGIGAIIAAIAAVVYLVVKNMDKIRGSTKAWTKLKAAFDVIKNAALEIVRPIQDIFAAFGGGGDSAEAAGNGIAKAFEAISGAVLFVARIFQWLVKNVIQPYLYGIVNIVMAVVSLFKGNWQDAFKFLIAGFASMAKGVVNLFVGMAKGLVGIVVKIVNGILNIFSKIPGMGGLVKNLQKGVASVGNFITGAFDKVGKGITGLLDKGAALGIKKSSNTLKSKGKPAFKEAGTEVGDAGNEAITSALGNEENVEDASKKLANAVKEGVADAAQKLYDFVIDRMGNAIKQFVSDSVKALNKQKESALKVFDVQLNTLMKLEKAEESLTKKKEYETNRRKLIDDATLRAEVYRRNRALAIYEGRVDDARMLDLEEQAAAKESTQELSNLDESRRQDLAKENLDAMRQAINDAKELAGKFFDESVEKFQQAAEHITRIAPVTIEEYTAQLEELKALTATASDNNNIEFGKMFEKFSTTITEKMPNAVDDFGNAVGAFTTPLDELVNLAASKYGLGTDDESTVLGVTRRMADSVIGITLGMLVDMGDKFGSESANITEKFGDITGGIRGDIGKFKTDALSLFTTLLEETKTAFLGPYKKALDEADPTSVFEKAIKDGNEEILNSFKRLLELNPELMKKIAASLDPAILKYINLKAAADAAAEAMSNAGGGTDTVGGSARPFNFTTADRYQEYLDRLAGIQSTTSRFPTADAARRANLAKFLKGYKSGGFIDAPSSRAVPAILHGGEFVINADAVKRIGIQPLMRLNAYKVPKFKMGGFVGYPSRFRAPVSNLNTVSGPVVNNVSTVNIQVENFIGQEEWFESMMKEYNVNVVPKNQKLAGIEQRRFSSYNGINQGM